MRPTGEKKKPMRKVFTDLALWTITSLSPLPCPVHCRPFHSMVLNASLWSWTYNFSPDIWEAEKHLFHQLLNTSYSTSSSNSILFPDQCWSRPENQNFQPSQHQKRNLLVWLPLDYAGESSSSTMVPAIHYIHLPRCYSWIVSFTSIGLNNH